MRNILLITTLIITLTLIQRIILVAQETTSSTIEIVDAKLGTGVQDRMITGEAETFPVGSQVFVWLKVTGAGSQDIIVTWKSGTETRSTTLSIGGSPWRTWASKTVRQVGDWRLTVASSDGGVLKEMSFKVE